MAILQDNARQRVIRFEMASEYYSFPNTLLAVSHLI